MIGSGPAYSAIPTANGLELKPQKNHGKNRCGVWCAQWSRLKATSFIIILCATVILVMYKAFGHDRSPKAVFVLPPTPPGDDSRDASSKIRIKHTNRHLPQCIIIGMRKAGTRALLTYLNLHPHIQTAKNEVHFFDNDENYAEGLEWYRKKMPYSFSDQLTIEKTPAYFSVPEVPERVYKMNATVKLLLIVRDPTERAISDYLQIYIKKMLKGKHTKDFNELAMKPDGEVNSSYAALRRSMYHKYMKNWIGYFPLKQFHFVSGEKLVANPLSELYKVEEFLNIEHRINGDMIYFNKTRGFYCIKNTTEYKCLNESKGRDHPYIDPAILSKLHQFFKPYNQKFFNMIKTTFDWPEH